MRAHRSKIAYLAVAVAVAACSASSSKKKPASDDKGRSFTLFATTELRGNIEPCGCTTDPMGDLARLVATVDEERASGGAVLVVDGGSTLFSAVEIPPNQAVQESLQSELLISTLTDRLQLTAAGLGPNDLARGPEAVRPPRQAANLPASSKVPTRPPELVDAGGVKVGIFGVVSPALLKSFEIAATDPIAAAAAAIADLRSRGAEVVIALAHMPTREARELARASKGIDVMVIGSGAPTEPKKISYDPMQVDSTWLIQGADRGQVVTRMQITVRGDGPLIDAVGQARATRKLARLDERAKTITAQLADWKDDPSADQAFVQAKRQELTEVEAERKQLAANPLQLPESGNWFVMAQVPVKKKLPCDQAVQARKVALDKKIGAHNIAAAADQVLPEPAEGQAGYVGIEECGYCHAEAVSFWKQTRHAGAWETLEKYGKEASYDCVYCHVTGWEQPGGATIAKNEPMRDVQCEVCHGPGSLHVDADGKEKPSSLVRKPPQRTCVGCHSPEHSDTFAYEAYLRDVTGPGHGATFRESLGDGPTGHDLRGAALKEAGASVGEGCLK